MTKIIGNIRPEDDYTHELGPEPNFNESVYFNFFDRQQNRGGFVRIGNRANEGYAEVTVRRNPRINEAYLGEIGKTSRPRRRVFGKF